MNIKKSLLILLLLAPFSCKEVIYLREKAPATNSLQAQWHCTNGWLVHEGYTFSDGSVLTSCGTLDADFYASKMWPGGTNPSQEGLCFIPTPAYEGVLTFRLVEDKSLAEWPMGSTDELPCE